MQELHYTPEDPDDDVLAKLRRERASLDEEIAQRAGVVTGGAKQLVEGQQLVKVNERYAREVEWATKAERHLWVATCAYVLTEDAVENMRTETIHLDVENLLSAPAVGCFICEQPYEAQMRFRKCPGDPS